MAKRKKETVKIILRVTLLTNDAANEATKIADHIAYQLKTGGQSLGVVVKDVRPSTSDETRLLQEVRDMLKSLKDTIAGEWPLSEAFTDLDDHPEQDEDAGFNFNVGFVRGACDALGIDVQTLVSEIEPDPPGTYFDDPGGADCPHCGEHSTDPNHAANCSEWPEDES